MNLNIVKTSLGALGAALALASVPASAAVTFFPPITSFQDDDLEFHIDTNENGILDEGDRLRGILEINETFGVFGGGPGSILPSELTGIFDLTVVGKVAAGGGLFNFAFGPTFGNVAVQLFLDPAPNLTIVPPNCATIALCEAAATDGALWAEAGFADADDQWLALNASDNIGAVAGGLPGTVFGTVNFALSVLTNNTGQIIGEVPLACPPLGCAGDGFAQVSGSGNILGGLGLTNGYQIRSDFDFDIATVPEPGSLALIALALLGLGGALRRKSA